MYIYTYMLVITINEKGHEFERARRALWKGLDRGKGREKNNNYTIRSKIKEQNKKIFLNKGFEKPLD